MTGNFDGTVDFGGANLTNSGAINIYVAKDSRRGIRGKIAPDLVILLGALKGQPWQPPGSRLIRVYTVAAKGSLGNINSFEATPGRGLASLRTLTTRPFGLESLFQLGIFIQK